MRTIRFLTIAVAGALVASTASAYTVKGTVGASGTCKVEGASVEVFDVNQLPGGVLNTRRLGTATTDAAGKFTVTFPWTVVSGPPLPPSYESGGPDVIVRIAQQVDGTIKMVLDEAPSAARWNVASGTTLSLSVSAMCQSAGVPGGGDFVFTRVGRIPTAEIDCRTDVASSGYAHHSTTTAINGNYTNQPFGGSMDLFGFFGSASGVNRYKLEYSVDGGATYVEHGAPLWDYYYDSPTHTWISESMGPVSHGTVHNLYKLPYVEKTNAWAWFNRLAVFDTRNVADGLVRFRVRGYHWNSATNVLTPNPATLHIDPAYGAIRLLVDNTPPTYRINRVLLNTAEMPVCSVITLGATDTLTVEFTASDGKGHLAEYSLRAHHGHGEVVPLQDPPPPSPHKEIDGYAGYVSAGVFWANPAYSVAYAAPSAEKMPTCAYQLRLKVTKRTTDGYDLVYHDLEDNWHLAIQR